MEIEDWVIDAEEEEEEIAERKKEFWAIKSALAASRVLVRHRSCAISLSSNSKWLMRCLRAALSPWINPSDLSRDNISLLSFACDCSFSSTSARSEVI